MVVNCEGYSSWEPHWKLKEGKKSSRTILIIHKVKRKHLLDKDMQDPQDSLMESSSEGSPIKRASKYFIKNSNLWNSWDDGMMTYEVYQGIEAIFNQESFLKKLGWPKGK